MNGRMRVLTFTLGLGLLFAGAAQAVTINQGLTSGVLNTIEDQDREAYIDANGDGLLSVGDVFIGYARMDNFLPKGVSANNQVYAVLSNQITGIVGGNNRILSLGATTVPGLRLQDITGDPNTAGGMFAVYDRAAPFTVDLITGAAGPTLKNNIDLILAQGTLQMVAGLVNPDNYLHVTNGPLFPINTPNFTFPGLPVSVGINSFTGGLDFLVNNTGFAFLDTVVTVDALGALHTTQLGIANGATRGAFGDGQEAVFGDASGYGAFQQCAIAPPIPTLPGLPPIVIGNVPCGFVTDADFFVNPIPEPGTVLLMGSALIGLAGLRRRLNRKA